MVEVNSDLRVACIKHEIKAASTVPWPFRVYCEAFDYNPPDLNLKGKRILDVGAGRSEFFVQSEALGADVIRLDPRYSNCKYAINTREAVVGIAQNLPFKANLFDETIALYSFYWIFTDREKALLEMIRVTKPGGKIKICPADESKIPDGLRVFDKLPSDMSIISGRINNNCSCRTLVIEKNPTYSLTDWERLAKDILSFVKQDLSADPTIAVSRALKDVRLARAKIPC